MSLLHEKLVSALNFRVPGRKAQEAFGKTKMFTKNRYGKP